jgi:hypothetical protein
MKEKIWTCKIGGVDDAVLAQGADLPMRQAVQQAFYELTGQWPEFTFSGWGGSLTKGEREVVDNDRKRATVFGPAK